MAITEYFWPTEIIIPSPKPPSLVIAILVDKTTIHHHPTWRSHSRCFPSSNLPFSLAHQYLSFVTSLSFTILTTKTLIHAHIISCLNYYSPILIIFPACNCVPSPLNWFLHIPAKGSFLEGKSSHFVHLEPFTDSPLLSFLSTTHKGWLGCGPCLSPSPHHAPGRFSHEQAVPSFLPFVPCVYFPLTLNTPACHAYLFSISLNYIRKIPLLPIRFNSESDLPTLAEGHLCCAPGRPGYFSLSTLGPSLFLWLSAPEGKNKV